MEKKNIPENAGLLKPKEIMKDHQEYSKIANPREKASELFHHVEETKDVKDINRASEILIDSFGRKKLTKES